MPSTEWEHDQSSLTYLQRHNQSNLLMVEGGMRRAIQFPFEAT